MTQTESKALTPQQNFEEKVKGKLRDNIGDLMPDEVLAEMVKKAMDEMFFTRREKKSDGWNSRVEMFPSWFEDEVSTALKKRILAEVKIAVDAKQEALQQIAVELITENLPKFIVSTLVSVVGHISTGSNYNVQAQILQMLRDKGINV